MKAVTQVATDAQKLYAVGTLRYNLFQLTWVFIWMLWGALAIQMQSSTFNAATPFLFRRYDFSDTQIVLILGTVMSLMNMVMNPILSFCSDRCRSRWGRRRPFILYTALPLGAALAMMPYYPRLAELLPPLECCGLTMMELLLTAGAMIYFFCFLFVGAIYYYYIPDVIPEKLMGRYYGYFRTAGIVAGMVFSRFLFPLSVAYPQWIYPAMGIFYSCSAILMCYFVREGEYPPPAGAETPQSPWFTRVGKAVRSYFGECFSQKYYWCFYLFGMSFGLSGCINVFNNFFYIDSCGLTLDDIGTLNVWLGIINFVTCLLAGYLVDRAGGFQCAITALGGIALFQLLGGLLIRDYASVLLWRGPLMAVTGIYAVACGRILVEVFPRSRFGQFASAQAMFISLCVATINYPVGKLSDLLKSVAADEVWTFGSIDVLSWVRNYRFIYFWSAGCALTAMLILAFFFWHFQRRRTERAADL